MARIRLMTVQAGSVLQRRRFGGREANGRGGTTTIFAPTHDVIGARTVAGLTGPLSFGKGRAAIATNPMHRIENVMSRPLTALAMTHQAALDATIEVLSCRHGVWITPTRGAQQQEQPRDQPLDRGLHAPADRQPDPERHDFTLPALTTHSILPAARRDIDSNQGL